MISTSIDVAKTSAAISQVARGLRDRTALHGQIGAQLYAWVIRNFEQEGGLTGAGRWAPLKAGGRWKGRGKNRYFQTDARILQDTGNLRNSFAPFYDNDTAGVGARASYGVDYAAVHQQGDPGRNLPARPMLPPEDVALDIASRIYTLRLSKLAQDAGLSS
jgi:phage gpG-like protein